MQVSSRRFDDFYDHYQPFVAAFVGRRVPVDAAPDIVAEVFAVAWKRRQIIPVDALPWLYRTARNVVGTHYRSAERLTALRTKLRAVPVEASADPSDVFAGRDALVAAFSSLNDDERELLLLVAWEGLSNAETAEVMGIGHRAVAVRIHRARSHFNEALSAYVSSEPRQKTQTRHRGRQP